VPFTLLVPDNLFHPSFGLNVTVSTCLSVLFLVGMAFLISYLNRSVFVVTSDRYTLPFVFLLTVLSDPYVFSFSADHIVALLNLFAICFMLRYLIKEKVSKSDYFIWCLLLSISSAFYPQLIWLLIPGLLVSFEKGRKIKMSLVMITLAALILPLFYKAAYLYVFHYDRCVSSLMNWLMTAVRFEPPRVYSLIRIFYFSVVGIIMFSTVVSVLSRYDQLRNTILRKQARFIFSYLFTISAILPASRHAGSPFIIFAIPWSLLFLYYGEINSYSKGWRNLILLSIVATIVLRVYEII